MGLNCGIIGVTNIGKTTLFNCFSESKGETSNYAFSASRSNLGQVKVPDERLNRINALIDAAKVTPTTVDIIDIPGLARGSSKGEGVGNTFLSDIRNCDALIHVLRCFDDEEIPHVDQTIDPVRDKETIDLELQIKDLESLEKRMTKLEKTAKAGDKKATQDLQIIQKIKDNLESFVNIRDMDLGKEEQGLIEDLFLLTGKPVIYVCNVDDKSATRGNQYSDALVQAVAKEQTEVLIIAARMESEIAELEDPVDRMEFLNDMGLEEPGVNKLIRSAYDLLSLETFFTAGPKEVRAWTIKKGMTAPQAAGVIHSDLERGFIRAEVMKYNDFIELKSEHACREAGKLSLEGKSYIVQDGDILHIRFNV